MTEMGEDKITLFMQDLSESMFLNSEILHRGMQTCIFLFKDTFLHKHVSISTETLFYRSISCPYTQSVLDYNIKGVTVSGRVCHLKLSKT